MPTILMQILSVRVLGKCSVLVRFDMDVCLNDVGSGSDYSMLDFSISALNIENWRLSDGTYDHSVADVSVVPNYNNMVIIQFVKELNLDETYYLYPSSNIKDATETYSCNTSPKSISGLNIPNAAGSNGRSKVKIPQKRKVDKLYTPGLIVDTTNGLDLFNTGSDDRRIIMRRMTFEERSLLHDSSFGASVRPKSLVPSSPYEIKNKISRQLELHGGVKNHNVTIKMANGVAYISISGNMNSGVSFSATVESGEVSYG